MPVLKSFIPRPIVDELKLFRLKKRFPHADKIRSPLVSTDAKLGHMTGIAEDVIVNAGVSLGDYTYVSRRAIVFSGTIGNYCSIAHYVQIGADQHPINFISTSPNMYAPGKVTGATVQFNEYSRPPVIGSDVWIGSSAHIMQGVTIGHGAIVAAGSVVTKDVEPYTIVAGVPARKIKDRFPDDVKAKLLAMEWWNHPLDRMPEFAPLVAAGEKFTDLL